MGARRRASLAIGSALALHGALAWLLTSLQPPAFRVPERVALELIPPPPRAPAPATPTPAHPRRRETAPEAPPEPPPPPEPEQPSAQRTPEPPPPAPSVRPEPLPLDEEAPPEAPNAPRVTTTPSFLERVLRGDERGPSAAFDPLDGGPNDLDDYLSLEEETHQNVAEVVALPPDPYLTPRAPVQIVVVDPDRRRSVAEVIEELELDGRRRAVTGRSSGTLLLERRGDGSLVYDAPGFEAVISRDGRVAFFDKAPIEAAPGPLGGDGRGSPQSRGSGTLVDELMGSKMDQELLPFLSGVHDLERALLSVSGVDVYSREKAWFLWQTFELRASLREALSPSRPDAG